MQEITLKAQRRAQAGKKYNKKLRHGDSVPGVLYGKKSENVLFSISEKELKKIIYTNKVFIINLDVDGEIHKCIRKDTQFHPVTDKTLHIDFLKVNETDPIKIYVPVALNGFAKGVQAGGFLYKMKLYLRIEALLKNIPDQVDIDVTELELGKSLQIKDIKLENINILEPASDVVAMVKLTRAAMSKADSAEEDAEETEETAE